MTDGDQFMTDPAQNKGKAHGQTKAEGAGAGTSSPSKNDASNDTYHTQRHSYIDARRTGLKATDRHYSWREVFAVNHVHPGR